MSPRRRRRRGARAGFTVLDVLLSILIMLVGVTGLLAMQITSLNANLRAREFMEATQLCQNKLEEFRVMAPPYPDPPDTGELLDVRGCYLTGDQRPLCQTQLNGTVYTRTWEKDPNLQTRVAVTTSWTTPDGTPHKVTVSNAK